MLIRAEEARDRLQIERLLESAFHDAEEMALADTLRDAEDVIASLVAEVNGHLHGYILFTRVNIEKDGGGQIQAASLAPVAVLPESRNMGIGSRLVRQGLAQCEISGYPLTVVLGPTRFFPRFGFMPACAWGLRCPCPGESFMVYSRDTALLQSAAGEVRYPEPFIRLFGRRA